MRDIRHFGALAALLAVQALRGRERAGEIRRTLGLSHEFPAVDRTVRARRRPTAAVVARAPGLSRADRASPRARRRAPPAVVAGPPGLGGADRASREARCPVRGV